jgi:hypothetical protein
VAIFFSLQEILWQHIPFLILFFVFGEILHRQKNAAHNHELLGFGKKKNALFHTLQTMFFNRQIYANFQPEKSDFTYTKDFAWSKNIEGICFFSTFIISHV